MFKFLSSMQELGVSDEDMWNNALQENAKRFSPPLEEKEISNIYGSALSFPKGFRLKRNKNGKVEALTANFEDILEKDPRLSGKIRKSRLALSNILIFGEGEEPLPWVNQSSCYQEMTDYDEAELKSYIERRYGIYNEQKFSNALRTVSGRLEFDEFENWLNGLPAWDGTERVKHLLHKYLGVEENQYTQEAIKLYMVAAIARTFHPGRKFDYCLIVVGDQGVGKSLFFRKLAVNDEWFCDNMVTLDGKDAMEILRGMKMIELAELSAFKSAKDIEHIKAFITSQTDIFRSPYDKYSGKHQRQCVFCGTTNDRHFLVDSTGNRRYMPVQAVAINREQPLDAADPDEVRAHIIQCWAEAYHIYKTEYANPDKPLILSKQAEAIAN
ncbi:MAG: hypothetical protein HUJ76_12900, partial [Parasporobacterium sp.]|nr:hypothetical protein [Parasporobacterium sp.]